MRHDTAGPTMLDRFGGELLDPSDPGYEEARRVFNGAVDRRPALIARCRRVDDVIAALAYARDPVRRRARVEGGATWAEPDRATQAHGWP